MNITSKALAWACATLLALYLVSAVLVATYVGSDDYNGTMAALFAANAGTALLVSLVFGQPEFRGHTPRALRLVVLGIGAVSGFLSAMYWMFDEVDNIWLLVGAISPVVVILFVLTWFIDKVNKEGPEHEGE